MTYKPKKPILKIKKRPIKKKSKTTSKLVKKRIIPTAGIERDLVRSVRKIPKKRKAQVKGRYIERRGLAKAQIESLKSRYKRGEITKAEFSSKIKERRNEVKGFDIMIKEIDRAFVGGKDRLPEPQLGLRVGNVEEAKRKRQPVKLDKKTGQPVLPAPEPPAKTKRKYNARRRGSTA